MQNWLMWYEMKDAEMIALVRRTSRQYLEMHPGYLLALCAPLNTSMAFAALALQLSLFSQA